MLNNLCKSFQHKIINLRLDTFSLNKSKNFFIWFQINTKLKILFFILEKDIITMYFGKSYFNKFKKTKFSFIIIFLLFKKKFKTLKLNNVKIYFKTNFVLD